MAQRYGMFGPRKTPDPPAAPEADAGEDPWDPVSAWRFERLLAAGWDLGAAVVLASSDCDLHRACDLLANGCSLATAWEILT